MINCTVLIIVKRTMYYCNGIPNGIITVALTVGACDHVHVPSKAVIPLRFIVTFMDRKSYGQSMSEGMHNHISNVQASCSWQ